MKIYTLLLALITVIFSIDLNYSVDKTENLDIYFVCSGGEMIYEEGAEIYLDKMYQKKSGPLYYQWYPGPLGSYFCQGICVALVCCGIIPIDEL